MALYPDWGLAVFEGHTSSLVATLCVHADPQSDWLFLRASYDYRPVWKWLNYLVYAGKLYLVLFRANYASFCGGLYYQRKLALYSKEIYY